MKRIAIVLLGAASLVSACKKQEDAQGNMVERNVSAPVAPVAGNGTDPNAAAPAPAPAATPATVGFDPASAPVGSGTLGAWPYFGIMDGFQKRTRDTMMSSENKKWLEDVDYDRTDFFDGTKLIPVEGRTIVTGGLGDTASFFQVEKTYEKLVHDLGGVTVYEGNGQPMADRKLKFEAPRFRANYELGSDRMGVYMVRLPDRQVWVEVYQPWEDDAKNYWLTIVATKPLEVKVHMIPAEQMKQLLDAQGHVALYINFDTDKATVRPESQPIIAEIVKLLTENPDLKLEVQGHTDNAGTPAHNQALSDGRANAVVGALIAQGVAMNRLTPKGYGQTKPIADNATDDGKAKNRRVELVKR